MQIKGRFVHIDENCPVFRHLKDGEACFYKKVCDAICKLNDDTAEYKRMREELDFRAFPEAWKKKELEILGDVAKVIRHLEEKGNFLDAKRLKQAYGFDTAKRMSSQKQ
jgi:hypothetical protein